MPAIVTSKFRLHNSEQFVEAFSEASPTNMYLFIGRVEPWTDDVNPPSPTDDFSNTEYSHWTDMISAKRVQSGEVNHVVPRHDWTSGTVYTQYTADNDNIFNESFYVVNSEFNVYKCLFNNSGAQSTVEPTGTGTSRFETGDAYVWQYMYSITAAETLKFVTPEWIPAKIDSTVATAAVDGALDIVLVTNGGSGYTAPTVTISGDGTGATATATVNAGVIEKIEINDRGSDYTNATITITDSTGTGATATAVIGPKGGHGSDTVHELGGFFVMLNSRLEYGEGGNFPTNNDYRKIGLVRDPFEFGTTTLATGTTYAQDVNLTVVNVSGTFEEDETITGGTSGATAKVVSWDSVNGIASVINVVGTFVDAETITGGTSAATADIDTSGVDERDLQPYSGDVIYVENRRPITRASDQIEDIKLIVEF
jgi:hypothetical protein